MRIYDIDEKLNDYTYLDWTERKASSGTSGSLLKARQEKSGLTYFYKLSSYDPYRGIFGSECVNELVACRLMNLLGIEHLQYKLVHAKVSIDGREYETWMNKSVDFRKPDERKIALDTYYEMYRTGNESPLDFCNRMGWGNIADKLFFADFLIANRDRHGANIEVLRNSSGEVRLAPVFDNGLSFLAPIADSEEKIRAFDPMTDVYANNFIGSRSLQENLRLIVSYPEVDPIDANSEKELMAGLEDALPGYHREKIWQIIYSRWKYYEDLCDKRQQA